MDHFNEKIRKTDSCTIIIFEIFYYCAANMVLLYEKRIHAKLSFWDFFITVLLIWLFYIKYQVALREHGILVINLDKIHLF